MINPPPKPAARRTKVVPIPVKNAFVLVAMFKISSQATNARSIDYVPSWENLAILPNSSGAQMLGPLFPAFIDQQDPNYPAATRTSDGETLRGDCRAANSNTQ